MLTVYIVCAVFGGGLMVLSALGGVFHGDLGGDHDVSFDSDHQIDFQHDLSSTDVEHTIDVHHDVDLGFGASDFWLAFMSMRFVTYFAGVFGVMGTVLTLMGMSSGLVAFVSVLSGLVIGYGGALLFRYMKAEGETSGVTANDYVGAMGRMLVAVRPSQPGKVRVSIKGDTIDMIALSEGDKEIGMGEEIVVVGLEGDKVRVAPRGDYLD
jgi:membrane protein implicated in regulation of membrane protease activity